MSLLKEKAYQKQKQYWFERNEIRIEKEAELRNKIIKRLSYYIEKTKLDLSDYAVREGFMVITGGNFIEASYGEIKIKVNFKTVGHNTTYKLELSIVNQVCLEKFVLIHPNGKLYYPKISNIRVMPKDIEHLKMDIKKIDEEIIWLGEEIGRMDSIRFNYSYYNFDAKPDYKKLKLYENISTILDELL